MRLAWIPIVLTLAGCPAAAQTETTPAPAAAQQAAAPEPEPAEASIAIGPPTRVPDIVTIPELEGLDASGLAAHAVLCFWQRDQAEIKTTCLLLDANAPTTTVIANASITDKLIGGMVPVDEYGMTMGALLQRLTMQFKAKITSKYDQPI